MPIVDVIIVALGKPILVGIYKDDKIIHKRSCNKLASQSLSAIFKELFGDYNIKSICFANGPGSYMSIKLTYIFLKTISLAKNIKLYCVDGFYFNDNKPIRAYKDHFFFKEQNCINIKQSNCPHQENSFVLPKTFNKKDFSLRIEPLYILPCA